MARWLSSNPNGYDKQNNSYVCTDQQKGNTRFSQVLCVVKAIQLALDSDEQEKWPVLSILTHGWMVANTLWGCYSNESRATGSAQTLLGCHTVARYCHPSRKPGCKSMSQGLQRLFMGPGPSKAPHWARVFQDPSKAPNRLASACNNPTPHLLP